MPHAIQTRTLEGLARLPEWKIRKMPTPQLQAYLDEANFREQVAQDLLNWLWDWKRFLGRELDKRRIAAEMIEFRKQKDEWRRIELEKRNAALEEQYNRDTYAE
jgi:hypothetical protein